LRQIGKHHIDRAVEQREQKLGVASLGRRLLGYAARRVGSIGSPTAGVPGDPVRRANGSGLYVALTDRVCQAKRPFQLGLPL
jgi:hypothetical protein